MKILILNWRDPKHPFAGGAEKSVLEHAKYWKKMGAEITWFAASFKGARNEEIIDGIKIIRRGNHYSVHFMFFVYCLQRKLTSYDLVVDCFHFVPFFTPILMFKKKKIALIQETGGKLWFKNIFFPLSLIGFIIEPLFFLFYKKVEFITASESTKIDLIKFGIKNNRIHVIPHGADRMNSYVKKETKPTVLYLGLLNKDKGFEAACEAVSLVKKEIKDLQCFVAGKESKKGDFNWYVGRARKFTKYFGYVTEQEKFDLYKKAWILVHPSEKEGWGLTVIEAATQGTPTVGYDVPGLRDSIVNGKTGILVDKDPIELAREITLLIKRKEVLSRMSNGALTWSKSFDWGKSTRQSWEVISKYYEK